MALIIIRNALFVIFLVFCSLNLYSYKIDSGELHAFTSPAVKIVSALILLAFVYLWKAMQKLQWKFSKLAVGMTTWIPLNTIVWIQYVNSLLRGNERMWANDKYNNSLLCFWCLCHLWIQYNYTTRRRRKSR